MVEEWTRTSFLDLPLTHMVSGPGIAPRTTTWTRDASHRVTRVDYPDGSYETFEFYAGSNFGQLWKHRGRNGRIEEHTYYPDGQRERTTVKATDGGPDLVTHYTYTAAGLVETVTDPRGFTTSYIYNDRGQVTRVTHPGGPFTQRTYDAYGNPDLRIDELGHVWDEDYDEFRRLTKSTDPESHATRYEYGEIGGCSSCTASADPTLIVLPSGKQTKIEHDSEGRKRFEFVGWGSADMALTEWRYNAAGNVEKMIDPKGKSWDYEYDSRDRRTAAIDPLGNRTEWTFDAAGNALTVKAPDGKITVNEYDAMNRLTKTTDPLNQSTEFKYGRLVAGDGGDNMVELKDAKANTYGFTYDYLDRRRTFVYPGGSQETWAYNDTATVAQPMLIYTTRAGQHQSCYYDARGRDTLCEWDDGLTPAVTKTYFDNGLVESLTSSVSALSYTYFDDNMLKSETQAVAGQPPRTVAYTYDLDNNRATLTYPAAAEPWLVSYGYTGRNQMASLTLNEAPPLAQFLYDANGNRKTLLLIDNGTSTIYGHDAANRVTSIDHKRGTTTFASFGYKYDAVGNREWRQSTINSQPSTADVYGYDDTYQLTSVKYGVADPLNPVNPARTTIFDYDPVGNRETVTDSANEVPASYTANALNQYTAVDADTPTYDANGNLTSYNGWTYTYDAQNRLLSASKETTTVTMAYDPRNRCVSRATAISNQLSTINFCWDDWSLLEDRDETGTLIRTYIHGPIIDEILVMTDTTAPHYYHHDALMSTVALTDAAGAVEETYTYGVYGAPTIREVTAAITGDTAVGNRFLFTGREWVVEVSRYDYRNRVYSANLGRFLQTDPIRFAGLDGNLYRYCRNDCVTNADPYGLICCSTTFCRLTGTSISKISGKKICNYTCTTVLIGTSCPTGSGISSYQKFLPANPDGTCP